MSNLFTTASAAVSSTLQATRQHLRDLYTNEGPSDGYRLIPSYGATNNHHSLDGPDPTGQQRLGADATKIEPKVWLASERTFLNWLRVSLLISSFGLALFNASVGVKDVLGQTMGVMYTVLAILMVGYAYQMQQRRRHRIIYRFAGHHDDLYGPPVVCLLIFAAVLVNFVLRVRQREELRHLPSPKNPWALSAAAVDTPDQPRSPYTVIHQLVLHALKF